MLNINSITMAAVAEKAAQDAKDYPRWLTAIGRALVELDSNPWIERNDHGGLTIGSPSGECYAANGVCECKAYEHKIPCWHRATARLVRLCDEKEASLVTMPEGDTLDTGGMRVARKIAAARATALLNELFA